MKNSLAEKVMKAVSTITDIHNKQVAPLLTAHHRDINASKEDIQALYELVEMYFFVISKAMATGLFDKDESTGDRKDVMEIMDALNKMQDHYLACIAINTFLKGMNEDF